MIYLYFLEADHNTTFRSTWDILYLFIGEKKRHVW